jgi:hypothetical protein
MVSTRLPAKVIVSDCPTQAGIEEELRTMVFVPKVRVLFVAAAQEPGCTLSGLGPKDKVL